MAPSLPSSHRDLLEAPLIAHVATMRPDGSPQSNPMWFEWDGELVRFPHKTDRQKYQNLLCEPRLAFAVLDPTNPYRHIEVRARVESIDADSDGLFFLRLQDRYSLAIPIDDPSILVVISARVTRFVLH